LFTAFMSAVRLHANSMQTSGKIRKASDLDLTPQEFKRRFRALLYLMHQPFHARP
jgi:hypothetical protein